MALAETENTFTVGWRRRRASERDRLDYDREQVLERRWRPGGPTRWRGGSWS